MNLKPVRVKIVILFILGCLSSKLSAQVNFQETSLTAAQSKIATSNIPYLIYFSGVWCPSCQLMEETTFTDKKLGDQIQQNYLAYKVDIDSKEGKQWMEEYAVSCLPTTVFYSSEGQLLERLEKPITSTELLAMTTESGFMTSSLIATNESGNISSNSSNLSLNTTNTTTSGNELANTSDASSKGFFNGNRANSNNSTTSTGNGIADGTKTSNSLTYSSLKNGNNSVESTLDNGAAVNQQSASMNNKSNSEYTTNSSAYANNINEASSSSNKNGNIGQNGNIANQNTASIENQNTTTSAMPASGSNSSIQSGSSNGNYSSNQSATANNRYSKNTKKNQGYQGQNNQSGENYSAMIKELGVQISELKALSQNVKSGNTDDNSMVKSSTFSGSSANDPTNLGKDNSTSFLSPSVDNLSAQIAACKSLLTDSKSIDKLIHILENYQQLLTQTKAAQMQLAKQAVPSEYSTPSPSKAKISSKKVTIKNRSDLFAQNQQIINYLKLNPPIKNGRQYIVQIGKYSNVRNAERLVQIIQSKYDYPVKVLIENHAGKPVQTVYLGEFKTKKAAIAANENLKWIKRKGIVKKF